MHVSLLVLCVAAGAVAQAQGRCGDAADAELFRASTWRDLALYWEHHPGCNDGYFGEHVSEMVGEWLERRPTTLARLTVAARRHPTLMPLVLRHIDDISSRKRLARIRENADRRCPGGSENICRQILARVAELERE